MTDEEEVVPDSKGLGSLELVRDFVAEEEEQVEEARERREVMEHTIIGAAQRGPAPEYEAAPEYNS